jgi:hypothetical protein
MEVEPRGRYDVLDLSLELEDSPVLSALVVSRHDLETRRLSVLRNALREGIEL